MSLSGCEGHVRSEEDAADHCRYRECKYMTVDTLEKVGDCMAKIQRLIEFAKKLCAAGRPSGKMLGISAKRLKNAG
jgi:hypothetical protein